MTAGTFNLFCVRYKTKFTTPNCRSIFNNNNNTHSTVISWWDRKVKDIISAAHHCHYWRLSLRSTIRENPINFSHEPAGALLTHVGVYIINEKTLPIDIEAKCQSQKYIIIQSNTDISLRLYAFVTYISVEKHDGRRVTSLRYVSKVYRQPTIW